VHTSPEGVTTRTLCKENQYSDKDLGTIVSESKDLQGNKEIMNGKGDYKSTGVDGTEVTQYTNHDRTISRPDGSGVTVQHTADGHTNIHTWSKTDPYNNYTVSIDKDGNYEKRGTTGNPLVDPFKYDSGTNYQMRPNETDPYYGNDQRPTSNSVILSPTPTATPTPTIKGLPPVSAEFWFQAGAQD
jgi:hypothetical protein